MHQIIAVNLEFFKVHIPHLINILTSFAKKLTQILLQTVFCSSFLCVHSRKRRAVSLCNLHRCREINAVSFCNEEQEQKTAHIESTQTRPKSKNLQRDQHYGDYNINSSQVEKQCCQLFKIIMQLRRTFFRRQIVQVLKIVLQYKV